MSLAEFSLKNKLRGSVFFFFFFHLILKEVGSGANFFLYQLISIFIRLKNF